MKYIITEKQHKKIYGTDFPEIGDNDLKQRVLRYMKSHLKGFRPFEDDEWVGYTTDYAEKNNTFLFGRLKNDEKPERVYVWFGGFNREEMVEIFEDREMVNDIIKEFIQSFYKEQIYLI